MLKFFYLTTLCLCLFVLLKSEDKSELSKRVQEDVRKCQAAVYSADVDVVLSFSHPKILELMGGIEKAKETLTKTLNKLKESEMKVESLEFPEPPRFFDSKSNHFVIISTHTIISSKGQKAESLNFQLGIKAIGENKWTYIEGSRLNNENVKQLFPDFPDNYEFPKCTRKKL